MNCHNCNKDLPHSLFVDLDNKNDYKTYVYDFVQCPECGYKQLVYKDKTTNWHRELQKPIDWICNYFMNQDLSSNGKTRPLQG